MSQEEIRLKHWQYEWSDATDPQVRAEGGRYSMNNCLMEAVIQVHIRITQRTDFDPSKISIACK